MEKYSNNMSMIALVLLLLTNASEACFSRNAVTDEESNIEVAAGASNEAAAAWAGEIGSSTLVLPERWDGDVFRFAGRMIGHPNRAAILDADIELSRGDVDARGGWGDTRLTQAAFVGDTELVAMLLERQANVNAENMDGDSALTNASRNGNSEMVIMLLDRGAYVFGRNTEGESALVLAVTKSKNEDIVRQLVLAGSDCNLLNPCYRWMRDADISDEMQSVIDGAENERLYGTPYTRRDITRVAPVEPADYGDDRKDEEVVYGDDRKDDEGSGERVASVNFVIEGLRNYQGEASALPAAAAVPGEIASAFGFAGSAVLSIEEAVPGSMGTGNVAREVTADQSGRRIGGRIGITVNPENLTTVFEGKSPKKDRRCVIA